MAKTAEHRTVANEVNQALSFEEKFPIVRASQLSLEDSFLKYEPQTRRQRRLRQMLIASINEGVEDFRCPAMDPSLDKEGNLIFEKGAEAAVGIEVECWIEKFKQFMPEKNSRIATLKERIVFLGILIKYLIEEQGYEVSEAWEAICDNTKKLKGHEKHDFEPTGSRRVGAFYDLTNTAKTVVISHPNDLGNSFVSCGSSYIDPTGTYPMASFLKIPSDSEPTDDEAAWLVLDV